VVTNKETKRTAIQMSSVEVLANFGRAMNDLFTLYERKLKALDPWL
jgi:hypothetical protein